MLPWNEESFFRTCCSQIQGGGREREHAEAFVFGYSRLLRRKVLASANWALPHFIPRHPGFSIMPVSPWERLMGDHLAVPWNAGIPSWGKH